MKKFIIILSLLTLFSCNSENDTQKINNENNNNNLQINTEKMTKKLENWDKVAILKTTKWNIKIFLETKKTPITANNFIALIKKWYYNWTIFHRVIKDFMIQWWDPKWNWTWWESIYGDRFEDEFHKDLLNKKFTISMANAWKNTNWSQFFINVVDNVHLNNVHTVFWEVIEWQENVLSISKVKTWENNKPEKEVKIINAEVKEYKDWTLKDFDFSEKDAIKSYKEFKEELIEKKKI